jgi:ATP-dependent exoDNAse (exonuclease V) beta subunit
MELLWSLLDNLPGGEQDLLSGALHVALKKLTAMPDPESSADHGVQLMTVHKAKGLEFEVVIVPGLEARVGRPDQSLLSWLERGVPPDTGNAEDVTEFLIAPVQSKGADRGAAKQWVDRTRSEREAQEVRRLLYVAATRARQELHLFARLEYKAAGNNTPELTGPSKSLLATAWPALEEEVLAQFNAWKNAMQHSAEPDTVEAIATAAQPFVVPASARSTRLRRLPRDYKPRHAEPPSAASSSIAAGADQVRSQSYERHEGGLVSRALGLAVHRCFDVLARVSASADWETASNALQQSAPRIDAQIRAQSRALGIDPTTAADIAARAMETVRKASLDATCQWILASHADASSEVRWVGLADGVLRNVQVDRVFRAGRSPLLDGDDTWWIVDYKTYSATPGIDASALLPKLRALFTPQLEAYAAVLRKLHGHALPNRGTPIRAGIYYPRMLLFDWWEI